MGVKDELAVGALARALVRTGMYVDAGIDTSAGLDNPRTYAAAILNDADLAADGLHFVMVETLDRAALAASDALARPAVPALDEARSPRLIELPPVDDDNRCTGCGALVKRDGSCKCKVPAVPALHPDDRHTHSWGCRLCGVDRPPVPPLDVERLATVFQGDVMADWLGIVVGITNPKHPPLAPGFAHDFAAAIARESAALQEQPE